MARYFFHLRAGDVYVPDFDGADIEDFPETARHIMRILRAPGERRHDGWRVEVTDERGEFIDAIPVEELLGAVH